jgi:hypothetical protein
MLLTLKSAFLFGVCLFFLNGMAQPKLQLSLDWKHFLSKQDLVWNQMPKDYFEGAFVGNGLLGAMVFKDDQQPNALCFEIGRTDVYDHRTAMPSAYETSRLPIGQFLISPKGQVTHCQMRMDLWNAEIRGTITTSLGQIQFRCYTPSSEELILIDVQSSEGERGYQYFFRPQSAQSARYIFKRASGLELNIPYQLNPPAQVSQQAGIEIITQPLLMGDDYATAWKSNKTSDSTNTILITVANRWGRTRKPGAGSAIDAVNTIQNAMLKSMSQMEKAHRDWWHAYYPQSFFNIPDTKLQSFYWIQLYKLASATHPNRPVIDLMGPWFKPSSWPLLWMNLNVQLSYYTLGMTNHSDLEENLYQLLERHKDQLIANLPPEFQNDCAGVRNPVGYDDLYNPLFLSADTANRKEINIIVLPWLTQMYYLHNRRIMDDQALRNQVYPMMRRAFNVYLRIIYKGADGKYHIPYTYSDEYGNAQETSLNIALASWGFKTLIATAEALHIQDPYLSKWKEILSNMADYSINENGIMIGRGQAFAKPHRHYSHLFSIFPLYDLNLDNAANRLPLMQQSISHFTALDGDNCMYKFSGAASLWAAIGKGDSAYKWLNRSLDLLPRIAAPPAPARTPTVTPNTLYSERENPTFESPIASTRSMLDLLFQDWGGVMRIFPAIPSTWKDASFYQLKAQGGFLVSAKRENGITQFVAVKSLAGLDCVLQTDLKGTINFVGPKGAAMQQKGHRVSLKIPKGTTVVLFVGKKPNKFEIKPDLQALQAQKAWGIQ